MDIKEVYTQIIYALTDAKTKIDAIQDKQFQALTSTISSQLGQRIKSLSVQIGMPVAGELESIKATSNVGDPLVMFFGRKITGKKPASNQSDKNTPIKQFREQQKQSAEDAEFASFEQNVKEAYDAFPGMEDEAIYDSYSDTIIRGVGKMIGLSITERVPAKADVKLIRQIKAAMIAKKELDNKQKEKANEGKD